MNFSDKVRKSKINYPLIGCHVSIAGGIEKAPKRAYTLGCEVMQIFSHSPREGAVKKISSKQIKLFNEKIKEYHIYRTYIHSPYYINFASKNKRISYGSVKAIQKELNIASAVGAQYVITHLGSVKELEKERGISQTIQLLQETLRNYKGKAKLLLENTAGAGSFIGSTFSELEYIIKKTNHIAIAGICLDTQHSFASGYNWRDFNKTLDKIKTEISLKKIKVIHANDSLVPCGSHVDRHAHIGEGKIGLKAFQNIVKFAQQQKINMILETKSDKIVEDIKILKKFRKNI